MTVTYTWDIFASLDGYGSHNGDWGGYWGKQGPELLDHRLAVYDAEQRMVFGANTFREFVETAGLERRRSGRRRLERPDAEHAGNRGVHDPAGNPRLAERDRREW